MAKTPTWQRAEGKNPEGGLNEKGRASLRAAGHDIKRPQPEGGSRRDSFCARMKGMKAKLTSSETANDPDSRINKSLRKWNCADGGAVDPYAAVQEAAKGGQVWDKPRPKKLGKPEPLSSKEKSSAKAAAKAAGRPYPNLIDNMRAARADGGELDPYEAVQNAANTDGGMGNFSAEDIQRASHGATPAVPALTVTENAQPSTPISDSLRGAYNAAIPPTARLLAESAMGVHSPITERDFSQADIQNMKDRLVEQQQFNAAREKDLQSIQDTMTPEGYRHYQAMTDQPIGGTEDYRRFMANNSAKLQSFQDTRGQTSVPYGTTFGKEDQSNQPLSVYTPEQGNFLTSLKRSYTDPGYRTGMTLGRFNVYDTPQGRIAVDNYDFRGRKQSASELKNQFQTQPIVTAIRGAIPTIAPNIDRPVAINLDRPGNYTYTGKQILTPGSNLDPEQTQTPRQDEIADYRTKTPGYWKFNWAAKQSRTPDVTAPLPPRRPDGYADGGEVEGDVQFAPDDPYAKVQEAAKLPMMAQHEYAMRMPEPEVRYDTGPQLGEATLKGYDPTIKERIYQGIAGTEERPSPERAQFARGISQMAEFAPVLGNVMAGQEAQRRGDTKGMLMAALPVPGMATEARMAEAAASPVQQAAREAYQRVLNAQGMYSHAAEAAYNLPQAKGSYEQMMSMLKTAGVKPEEMRWSGVEQFVGQPVTREQLVSHFEQGVPKIEETVLSDMGKPHQFGTPEEQEAALNRYYSAKDKFWKAEYGSTNYDKISNEFKEAESALKDIVPGWGRAEGKTAEPTKFSQYTIPGGENYREVLLGLPSETKRLETRRREIEALGRNATEEQKSEWADIMNRLQPDDRDIEGISRYRGPAAEGEYTSSHWDQPNVLGHLRLSDRTGPQGEKILHMEELQSDWGQQGRSKGFRNEDNLKAKNDLSDQIHEMKRELLSKSNQLTDDWASKKISVDEMNAANRALYANYNPRIKALQEQHDAIPRSGDLPSAPYVESTKNWVDLGLKRALKEAAEKGYDKLVWTPGAEQAARYDLSKQVNRIGYTKRTDGKFNISAEPASGGEGIDRQGISIDEVENLLGKEIADKINKAETNVYDKYNGNITGELTGLDLSVGGEGMKGFYDKIIPTQLQKLVKKLDPQAKIELGGHPLLRDGEEVRAHSIQITPQMRKAILKGLPAYAKGGEVVNKDDPYDNIRLKAKNFPRARRASH